MQEQSAEQAAREYADALIAGDIGATLRKMTPDALGKAMELGNATWHFFSYDIAPAGPDGETYAFDVTYHAKDGALKLRQRFGRVEGAWLLVDIEAAE